MISLDDLRSRAPVLTPDDEGYVAQLTGFNTAIRHHPSVVVPATEPAHVAEAVRFAAAHGLHARVQATGHGAYRAFEDGVLVASRRMDAVTVDAAARVATVQAGATWGQVQQAASAHGLSAVPGSAMSVGAVGYTVGGGVGPLARSHGFTSDYVRGFEVVTGVGDLLTADAHQHPDLYWALRGGKMGLGIVTSMTLGLVPLPQLFAGALYFAAEHIEPVLRGWLRWCASAPDAVTTSLSIMRLPPFSAVTGTVAGPIVASLRFAHPGDPGEGEQLLAPLRTLAPAIIDTVRMLPPHRIGLIHNDADQPGPNFTRGLQLNGLDDRFAEALLELAGPGRDAPLIGVELRHLGGATRRDVAEGSAVGGRGAEFAMSFVGAPRPELFTTVLPAFEHRLRTALAPWTTPVTTINYAGEPAAEDLPRSWEPHIHERLQQIRRRYDPAGVFTLPAKNG